ncbi:hypothetical protein OEZ60_20495 [Defluviimonas sp. WL0024]|uniref:Uncharacterized protein n=1 Tax=Albidovulum salinarum TaxID=2984153 RepID=A0ABT2X8U3_9RHOB|nr:hypothetical protein [Defluviimonas sp. WL0024]MCU9850368.1 hypothetical protein [Defluviimonas sp. WL0024]
MKKPITHVSDHAMIRYFERVLGIDVEHHRRLVGRRVDNAVELGASAVTIDGFQYRLQEGTVTTVLEASRPDIRTGRQRRERDE